MQLPADFSDEWKKIGSKRSNKIQYIFVKEIE